MFPSWLRNLVKLSNGTGTARRRRHTRVKPRHRPTLAVERFEERLVPTTVFMPDATGARGDSNVPVTINVDNMDNGFGGAGFAVYFENSTFTVDPSGGHVRLGSIFTGQTGWTVNAQVQPLPADPSFFVLTASIEGSASFGFTGNGTLLEIDFNVNLSAPPGPHNIDLARTSDGFGGSTFTTVFDLGFSPYTLDPEIFDGPDPNDSEFEVTGSNSPPVADDDDYVITTRTLVSDPILPVSAPGVLVGDTDADLDALTAIKVSDPFHGLAIFNIDGSFTYTPDVGYIGPDSFTYVANDGQADSNVATVNLSVTPRLSIPINLAGTLGGTVVVPVNIDTPNPAGSGGLNGVIVAINYDTAVFSVQQTTGPAGDFNQGTVTATWINIVPSVEPATGEIGVGLSSGTPNTSTDGGSVVEIKFHVLPGAPAGPTRINLMLQNSPFNIPVTTGLDTQSGQPLPLKPAATNANNDLFVDGIIYIGNHFQVQAPPNVNAGAPFQFTVTAVDGANAVLAGYTGTVLFSSNEVGASLPGPVTLVSGVGTFSATFNTAGIKTITATDSVTATTVGFSNPINVFDVAAGEVTHFLVNAPANAIEGQPFDFTVTALDASDVQVTNYTGTVLFSSTSAGSLPGPMTLTGGTGIFSATLTTLGPQTITATDATTPTITGTSGPITVSPAAAAATHFSVTGTPGSVTAGNSFSFTVTALDASENTATSYTGTVAFTSTDPQADFATNNVTLVNGVGSFNVTLKTAGPQTITATDATTPSINGTSATITVLAAAAADFTVVADTPVTAGALFNVTVTAFDAFNNTATGYTGTVNFTSTDPQAPTPITSGTLNSGSRTFSATLKTAGPQTITAADSATPSINGISNTITVVAAAAADFSVVADTPVTAGALFNVTVTAFDVFNNTATSYAGTVTFNSTDPLAPTPIASGTLTNGFGTFSATLKTAGPQTITAADATTPSINGISNTITVVAAAAADFSVVADTPVEAGALFNVTVTAFDAFNNTATGYTGTVNFTSNDPLALTPITSGTLNSGTRTFSATLKTAGPQTITAADSATPSINGISNTITVVAAAAANFSVVASPPSVTAGFGNNVQVIVAARDAFNNTATGYAGTVTFTSTDSQALLPPDGTLFGGIGVFDLSLRTAGPQTITATDTTTPSINGTSNTVTVVAAAATHFLVEAPTSATPNVQFDITVSARDPFENLDTNYPGTVILTSTDPEAVLPAPLTLNSGTRTFGVTLKTSGPQTITATDAATPSINGTSNTITVAAAAAATHFSVTGTPGSVTAGNSFDFTVTALDASESTVTGYTGTVLFASTDPQADFATNNVTLTNGVGTFSVTLKTAGDQTITATDTATPTITGTSATITVLAAAASHFSVVAPTTATAGEQFSFTVTARDDFENTAATYTGTVQFTSTDLLATFPSNNVTLTSGQGSFNVTLTTAGDQTITATDTTTPSINGTSDTITVVAAAAAHFIVFNPDTVVTAGQPLNFFVTAIDEFGNVATSYTGTVNFTVTGPSSAGADLPPDSTLSNGTGFFSASFTKADGPNQIVATDTATPTITGTSGFFTVAPDAATHFSVTAPSPVTAGSQFNVTVVARDTFENIATGYSGTVQITSSDPQADLPANDTLSFGIGLFSVTLETAGQHTVTATDTTTPSINGISNSITVIAAAATHFDVVAPLTATTGAPFDFTVFARDQFQNLDTNYTGTVTFTSTDLLASLPNNSTLNSGTRTFSATLITLGQQTITAADVATPSINGTSNTITVQVAAATHFSVTGTPGSVTAGDSFSFTVTALDAFDNTDTGYTGTVEFTSTDSQANFATNNVTLTNGVGTFNVTLQTAGDQTITATDTTTPSINGTSDTITVLAAAATRFEVATASSTTTAGDLLGFTVTAFDGFNNTATSYAGTVQFTTTDPLGTFPNNDVTLTNGQGSFNVTLRTVGPQTITATDATTPSINGTSNTVTVVAAAASHFDVVTASSTTTAGDSLGFTVTALDDFNNTATSYTGTVAFTSTDTQAIFPNNDVTLTGGQGSFSVTLRTAGDQTITATDATTPSINGTSNTVTVVAAAAAVFSVVADTPVIAGAVFNVTVTAFDAFNNTATGYTGTVTFTSTDPLAPTPIASGTLNSGTGTFLATLKTAGPQTITASDSTTPSINGTSNTITVIAAAATHFDVVAPPTVTTGAPFDFTVSARDEFQNLDTNYSGTVTFTSTDLLASLPNNSTLNSGTGTFSATLVTLGQQTITAADVATPSINGTSNTITVQVAAATHFSVTGTPSSVTAGNSFSFTVTALDAFDNTDTGYTGTVEFTSTDSQANFATNNVTLTNGVGTFNVTLQTAGDQTITATDTTTPSINGTSDTITVLAAAATRFEVATASSTTTAGDLLGFTVTAFDGFNNTATSYAGTVQFTTTDPLGTFPNNDVTLTNGQGSFNVTLRTVGPQTITATDATTPSINGTSNTVTVVAAAASHFDVVTASSTTTAGDSLGFTVTALDDFNNTATSYTGTVLFTSTDAQATFPSNNVTLTGGQGSFNVTLKTAGDHTVTATDTTTPSINGTSNTVTVVAAAAANFSVVADTPVTAGALFNVTVTAFDAFNNTATGYLGTVNFTSTDPLAPTPITSGTLTSGFGTFSATLKTAGPQTITASDATTPSINGTSNTITVIAAAATHFEVVAPPTVSSGALFDFTVSARDEFENLDTNYTGTVAFTSTDGSATLPTADTLNSGTRIFSATLVTTGPQTITAADSATPSINGTSNTITVAGAAATHFSVTGTPSNITAGVNFSFTVTALDASDNTDASYSGTVLFTSTDVQADFATNNVTLVNGVGTFNVTLKTAGDHTITATDANTPSINGTSATITVLAAAADHFTVSGTPNSITAGESVDFTVTAFDQFNNLATSYSGTVTFTSTDDLATMPPNSTLTSGVGVFGIVLKRAGEQTVTASDITTPSINGTSNTITVAAAATSQFSVVGPAGATTGIPFSFTVSARDSFGNLADTYAGTVEFTSSDPSASLPLPSTLSAGVRVFSATLVTDGGQTITATDTTTPSITGTSNTITVTSAATTHFTVSAPSQATAGVSFDFTVTARDASNNVSTGYTGTVSFATTDGAATPPVNATLVNGEGTFSVTLETVGNHRITATDTVTESNIKGTSGFISVIAGAATHFEVGAPPTAVAGTPIIVSVTAFDQFDNVATGYSGTVQLTSTDSQAILQGDSALTNGVGFFAVTLGSTGNQQVTATDTATLSINGTSGTITVGAGAATQFSVVVAPSTVTAGVPFNFTVTALDAFNNTANGYSGTVQFSSTDPSATVPGNATLSGGTGSFSATLQTAGIQRLIANDVVTTSISGTSGPITVSAAAAAATSLEVIAPSDVTAGATFDFTVTARDQFNNTATGYTGTVLFTSTDAQVTFLSNNVTLIGGQGLFSAILRTSGNQTITAVDSATASINGTSSNIVVHAAAASNFLVDVPTTATAGGIFVFNVTARDAFNNTASGYNGTVHFASSDALALLPDDSTLTGGFGLFSATLRTAGSQVITAVDTSTPSISGTSDTITVVSGTTTHFSVSAPPSITAGSPFISTVIALDAFDNTATSYTGTVHITSSDPQADLPLDATLTNGVGNFVVTLKTAGGQTVTAADSTSPGIKGTSTTVSVSAAATHHFTLNAIPSSVTAGQQVSVTVTARDLFDNQTSSYSGTVQFTSTDALADLPGNSTLAGGTGVFNVTMKESGPQTITATDITTPSITGTSNTISVSGASATQFVVTAPSTAAAGVAFNFSVVAADQFGNVNTTYSGTVQFSSNDPAASLPDDLTLVAGSGTFSATLATVGDRTLTATDVASNAITGTSETITVAAGAATSFSVSAPASASAGEIISVTVTARDSFGNTATSYSGTVQISSTDGSADLPPDGTLTGGTGAFLVTLKTVGNQRVSATDTVTASINGTSNTVAVSAAAATHFDVSIPPNVTAGNPILISVTARDVFNNVATSYAGLVHFSSTDSQASLPPDSTLASGVGFFAGTLKTTGSHTITATDTSTPSINGTSNTVPVDAAAVHHFQVEAPPTAVTGVSFDFDVFAEDEFNNTALTYTGTVQFTSNDPAALFVPTSSTLTGGIGTFSVTLNTAGDRTITATDSTTASLTGTSSTIVTRGLVVSSITPTATGFVAQFNKPFDPNSLNLYDGNGTYGAADVILLGASIPVRGTLILEPNNTSFTFIKTGVGAAGLLSAGSYTLTMRSASDAFKDLLGGLLDGNDDGAGGDDYTQNFSVASTPTVSLSIPDFSRGPDSVYDIRVPNNAGGETQRITFTGTAQGSAFTLAFNGATTGAITYDTAQATLQTNIQNALNALATIDNSRGSGTLVTATSATGVNVLFTNLMGGLNVPEMTTTAPTLTISTITQGVSSGIPITLNGAVGVTALSFDLHFDPNVLSITGTFNFGTPSGPSGSTFALLGITPVTATESIATFQFNIGSASPLGATATLGHIVANVPDSAENLYKEKRLLSMTNILATGAAAVPVANNGVQIVTYFGDVNGDGTHSALDASLISRVATAMDTGFAGHRLAEPSIIGDLNSSGSTDSTDVTMTNRFLAGLTVAQIPKPPTTLTIVPSGPDPTLSLPPNGSTVSGETAVVPVFIDTARPPGSTGLMEAVLALRYDPTIFTVSPQDIQLGTVPASGTGWRLLTAINEQTGEIGIDVFSITPITTSAGGSLVTITLHVRDGAQAGTTVINLVPQVNPTGQHVYRTAAADAASPYILYPVVTAGFDPGVDGRFSVTAAPPLITNSGEPIVQRADVFEFKNTPGLAKAAAFDIAIAAVQTPLISPDVSVLEKVFGNADGTASASSEKIFDQPGLYAEALQKGVLSAASDLSADAVRESAVWKQDYQWTPQGWVSDDWLESMTKKAKRGRRILSGGAGDDVSDSETGAQNEFDEFFAREASDESRAR